MVLLSLKVVDPYSSVINCNADGSLWIKGSGPHFQSWFILSMVTCSLAHTHHTVHCILTWYVCTADFTESN